MAWFCPWRTLCTTGCLMAALLLGGSVRAISFSAIEVIPSIGNSPSAYAVPKAVSPSGGTVGGIVAQPFLDVDCASLRCSTPFLWTATGEIDTSTLSRFVNLYERANSPFRVHPEEVVGLSDSSVLTNASWGVFNEPLIFHNTSPELLRVGDTSNRRLFAVDISADGDSAALTLENGGSPYWQTVRWTRGSGIEVLVDAAGPTAISGDGQVVVGIFDAPPASGPLRGFRWSDATGAIPIEAPTDTGSFVPSDVTTLGDIIVGNGQVDGAPAAFTWNARDGVTRLGGNEELSELHVMAIAGDSAVAVGIGGESLQQFIDLLFPAFGGLPSSDTHAVLWDPDGNVHNLQTWLTTNHDLGDELAGWSLVSANAISADGRVIAGVGINPEGHFQGWVVDLGPVQVVPEPKAWLICCGAIAVLLSGRAMARFSSPRTIWTTGCLMAALLLGGSARGISFSAIEVPESRWAQFANVLSISADGTRLGGVIVLPHVEHDCAAFICAVGFDWSLPQELYITGGLGPTNTLILSRIRAAGPHLALADDGYGRSIAITPSGVVPVSELMQTSEYVSSTTIADDGRTIAGTIGSDLSENTTAFRWNDQVGLSPFEMPGESAGSTIISGDGNVVFGIVWNTSRTQRHLFRWSETTGSEFVGSPDAVGSFNLPEATNFDGSLIVGRGTSSGMRLPFSWEHSEGMQHLPLPEGSIEGGAFDTTARGDMIVGFSTKRRDNNHNWSVARDLELLQAGEFHGLMEGLDELAQAVFWQDGQVHNLQTWLTQNHNLGDELAGWSLISANAISADGSVIAGVGINPEGHFQGWVVDLTPAQVVPEPTTSVMLLASISLIIAGWILTRRQG